MFFELESICRKRDTFYITDITGGLGKIEKGKFERITFSKSYCVTSTDEYLFSYVRKSEENSISPICIGENLDPFIGSFDPLAPNYIKPTNSMAIFGDYLYFHESYSPEIKRVKLFKNWSVKNHLYSGTNIRKTVQLLLLLRKSFGNDWYGIPKEIIFFICEIADRE